MKKHACLVQIEKRVAPVQIELQDDHLVLLQELGELDGSLDDQLDEVRESDVAVLFLVGHRVVGWSVKFPGKRYKTIFL